VSIPSSITSIGEATFAQCSGLTAFSIPSSVTSIGDDAFYGCSCLNSVTIPSSVTFIGHYAFMNCNSLASIFANSSFPINLNTSWYVFEGVNKTTCTLNVPFGAKELYAAAEKWKDFENIVEMTTGLKQLVQNVTQFKCYPNPFTDEIIIEIQNPKRTAISVDIYNLAGERIKNLAIQRKEEKLELKWNGTNDLGQRVVPGAYICRVNNQSKQMILMK
jgi:hypothetical protein